MKIEKKSFCQTDSMQDRLCYTATRSRVPREGLFSWRTTGPNTQTSPFVRGMHECFGSHYVSRLPFQFLFRKKKSVRRSPGRCRRLRELLVQARRTLVRGRRNTVACTPTPLDMTPPFVGRAPCLTCSHGPAWIPLGSGTLASWDGRERAPHALVGHVPREARRAAHET